MEAEWCIYVPENETIIASDNCLVLNQYWFIIS